MVCVDPVQDLFTLEQALSGLWHCSLAIFVGDFIPQSRRDQLLIEESIVTAHGQSSRSISVPVPSEVLALGASIPVVDPSARG